jgi:hypothetical protein
MQTAVWPPRRKNNLIINAVDVFPDFDWLMFYYSTRRSIVVVKVFFFNGNNHRLFGCFLSQEKVNNCFFIF